MFCRCLCTATFLLALETARSATSQEPPAPPPVQDAARLPNDAEQSAPPPIIQELLSDDWQVRAQARRALIQERKEFVSALTSAIEEKARRTSNHRSVEEMMAVLGDIRATEAIDVLVRHIAYPRTAAIDDRVLFSPAMMALGDGGMPAVGALVKIGEPSVDPVIRKIRTTESVHERIACVGVLKRLNTPFIRERIERAITISNEREKQSLHEALQLFDDWLSPKERTRQLQNKLKEFFENSDSRR